MNSYLLDTNIISHMMREPAGLAARQLDQATAQDRTAGIVTSSIVLCELRFGLQRKPNIRLSHALERILENIEVFPLDENAAIHYAAIRTFLEQGGTPLAANDLLIAAHALSLNATLVSADAAFSRVPGLRLENWLT